MGTKEFHYRWEWQLRASPEALWPLVTDTNRFNRDAGAPALEPHGDSAPAPPPGRRRLRLRLFGILIEWDEEPFEWVRPHRFGVLHRYRKGPVAEVRVVVELVSRPGGGTHLVYEVWAHPRTWLGHVAIPLQIRWVSAPKIATTFRRYDRLVTDGTALFDRTGRARFAPGGRARLAALGEDLQAQGAPADLVVRLLETIEGADDLALARLRPHALADAWRVSRHAVLELFLLATRAGLLDLRWDLLCPLCRGAKQSSARLDHIRSQVHCDTCRIDFTVNFDRSVELTFQPNPAVRPIESREFCTGGPQVTPHIVAQQSVPPGARRTITLPLEAGHYRLRTLALPGGQIAVVAPDGLQEATMIATASGWPPDEVHLALTPTVRWENATEEVQLFILERMAWSDQAVTAAEVTALQRFRDLFASEALRPGEQISVGSLAVVFTDLRESTRLYREIGDAPAFGQVMHHFDVMRDAISAEGGAVVKSMGDAVMAVFRRPVAAVRAARRAQSALASPAGGAHPLRLKVGIHCGPCIAVTLNDRLDYFGATVNIASRLVGLSSGRDLIVSDAVRADPEVAELLAGPSGPVAAEPLETVLRGFDAERFALWRVTPAPGAGEAGPPPPLDRPANRSASQAPG